MTTIAYDRPLRNFIPQLDATGHVTHERHRKDKVTLHHNGGRLSHEGVLSVWQVRPASAHFNIDADGTAAQYVRVNEYAWATGSTDGNRRSISIEMCNQQLGPNWPVSITTWSAAARLAGWLFARVIGARPTSDTLVRHKYWSATTCAGPHIDREYNNILAMAQQTYDRIVSGAEENEMGPDDRITLVAPASEEKGDRPPYEESPTLRHALRHAYFKGSDAYNLIHGVGDNVGIQEQVLALIAKVGEQDSKIQSLVAVNTELQTKVANLEVGGVSEERIEELAINAVDKRLGPN